MMGGGMMGGGMMGGGMMGGGMMGGGMMGGGMGMGMGGGGMGMIGSEIPPPPDAPPLPPGRLRGYRNYKELTKSDQSAALGAARVRDARGELLPPGAPDPDDWFTLKLKPNDKSQRRSYEVEIEYLEFHAGGSVEKRPYFRLRTTGKLAPLNGRYIQMMMGQVSVRRCCSCCCCRLARGQACRCPASSVVGHAFGCLIGSLAGGRRVLRVHRSAQRLRDLAHWRRGGDRVVEELLRSTTLHNVVELVLVGRRVDVDWAPQPADPRHSLEQKLKSTANVLSKSKVVNVDVHGNEMRDDAGNVLYEGGVSAEVVKWQKYTSPPGDALVASVGQPIRAGKNKGTKHVGMLKAGAPVLVRTAPRPPPLASPCSVHVHPSTGMCLVWHLLWSRTRMRRGGNDRGGQIQERWTKVGDPSTGANHSGECVMSPSAAARAAPPRPTPF
jgi:hypothetical protein